MEWPFISIKEYSEIIKKVDTSVAEKAITVHLLIPQTMEILTCSTRIQRADVHVAHTHTHTHMQCAQMLMDSDHVFLSTLHPGDKCQQFQLYLKAFCRVICFFVLSFSFLPCFLSPCLPSSCLPSFLLFFLFFVFFRAAPSAYGSPQARGLIRAAAARLRHSYSNAISEPCL